LDSLPLVRKLSRGLEAAWAAGMLSRPTLEPRALLEKAGSGQPGILRGGDWREAFELLTDDLARDAQLNPLGRTIAHGQLVAILRQRSRAASLWQRFPAILEEPVPAPVVVLGHMRSGTTRLHRMLACDPRFSFTRFHETLAPVAPSRTRSVVSASLLQSFLKFCNPQLGRIHPTSALAAEEEFGLHAFSFHGAMFEAQWKVPRFAAFCEQRDVAEVYAEFRRLVQTLRWRRSERKDKVQLLKAPQFMQEVRAVLDAFPEARIVWVRRDLGEVAASSASLVWHQRRIQSDAVDRVEIGREWLRKTQLRERRASDALSEQLAATLVVDYSAMNLDWQSEIRRIYRFLGLELSPAVVERMSRVAGTSAHKGHLYSSQQFGLDT
jgi:hypothetical protein